MIQMSWRRLSFFAPVFFDTQLRAQEGHRKFQRVPHKVYIRKVDVLTLSWKESCHFELTFTDGTSLPIGWKVLLVSHYLGGGNSNIFFNFHPGSLEKSIQFDEHNIFQMGWNLLTRNRIYRIYFWFRESSGWFWNDGNLFQVSAALSPERTREKSRPSWRSGWARSSHTCVVAGQPTAGEQPSPGCNLCSVVATSLSPIFCTKCSLLENEGIAVDSWAPETAFSGVRLAQAERVEKTWTWPGPGIGTPSGVICSQKYTS